MGTSCGRIAHGYMTRAGAPAASGRRTTYLDVLCLDSRVRWCRFMRGPMAAALLRGVGFGSVLGCAKGTGFKDADVADERRRAFV